MTRCTLVTGGDAARRAAAIAVLIDPQARTAVILEGPQSGIALSAATETVTNLVMTTIAVGCPCCSGGLVMRVSLDRMLRRRPADLFISLADSTHLPHLQTFLREPAYAALVSLAPVIAVDS